MNTPTLIASYVFALIIVALIGVVIRRMLGGWKHRSQLQEAAIGTLPAVPEVLGPAVLSPTRGMYVGCTIAPDWLDRVTVGDLGFRYRAVLTRYRAGILLERSGAGPIWIPQESITAVRVEQGLAGKVLPDARPGAESVSGILAIRWRLPSGTEVDTGFRGDDRRVYAQWTSHSDDQAGDRK